MFSIVMFSEVDHTMVRTAAQPGIKVSIFRLLGIISTLFIMRATLAVALGFSGSHE